MSDLVDWSNECYFNSARWFPELHKRDKFAQLIHLTLGLVGEAGEVANVVKKLNRHKDDRDINATDTLSEEIADVAIYLFNLCALLEIDLGEEIAKKNLINEGRWG